MGRKRKSTTELAPPKDPIYSTFLGTDSTLRFKKKSKTQVKQKALRTLFSAEPCPVYQNMEMSGGKERKYCDVTGLVAKYTDPQSGMRYHNSSVFGLIRRMQRDQMVQDYLKVRGGGRMSRLA